MAHKKRSWEERLREHGYAVKPMRTRAERLARWGFKGEVSNATEWKELNPNDDPDLDYGTPVITETKGSPLMGAFKLYKREPTPETFKAFQRQSVLVKLLNRPHTSWNTRCRVIEEMERGGWAASPHWKEIKWKAFYDAPEWRVPISPEELIQLDELEGEEYSQKLGAIVYAWLQSHPNLKELILSDADHLHFFVVWVAFQVWGTDQKYSDWLLRRVVKPSVSKLTIRLPIHKADDSTLGGALRDPWEELHHAGYFHLLFTVIPKAVYYVRGSLKAYWYEVVRKHFLTEIDHDEGRLETKDQEEIFKGIAELEDSQADLQEIANANLSFNELYKVLTPRQRSILMLRYEDKIEEDIALILKVSLSTVEKEIKTIKKKAIKLGIRPSCLQPL